jgi:hypothetical protein
MGLGLLFERIRRHICPMSMAITHMSVRPRRKAYTLSGKSFAARAVGYADRALGLGDQSTNRSGAAMKGKTEQITHRSFKITARS